MSYQCPICGYNRLNEPPVEFSICPCCGVEFGVDDFEMSHAELQVQWIQRGMPWFSSFTRPYAGWDALRQIQTLREIEIKPALLSEISFAVANPSHNLPYYDPAEVAYV